MSRVTLKVVRNKDDQDIYLARGSFNGHLTHAEIDWSFETFEANTFGVFGNRDPQNLSGRHRSFKSACDYLRSSVGGCSKDYELIAEVTQ